MAYSVKIDRVGEAGVPAGRPRTYEAEDEAEAVAIVTAEIDVCERGRTGIATVSDAAGRLLFTYTGRAGTGRG